MPVACSIFTLDGGGRSIVLGRFWYAHNSGTIKSCIRIAKKIIFGYFKKIITLVYPSEFFQYFFLNAPKTNFSNPDATFNGTTVMGRSKAVQNNWNPPSKVNIERATAICLKKSFFLKFVKNLENICFRKTALADPIFTLDGGFNCFGQLLIQSWQW